MSSAILNEAYERLHHAGPEWGEDELTNHGPMAVEVLVRRGHASKVHRWVDAYVRRLDDLPAVSERLTDRTWWAALGDGRRIGDWTDYFVRQLQEQPWPDVLGGGIAATHRPRRRPRPADRPRHRHHTALSHLWAGQPRPAGTHGYRTQRRTAHVAGSQRADACPPVLFGDGFESGTLSAWSGGAGLLVQQQLVADGAWAARSTTTGAASYAYRTLDASTSEVTVRLALQLVSISGTSSFNFLKVRTATGTAIAELFITPAQILGLRNDVTGIATSSPNTVTTGVWHDVRLHVVVNGTSSTTEVLFDGATVPALTSNVANLGTTGVGRVQVGENVTGRTADLAYDTVTVAGAAASRDPVLVAAGDIACDPLNPTSTGARVPARTAT
jgi:hypothetical protein